MGSFVVGAGGPGVSGVLVSRVNAVVVFISG